MDSLKTEQNNREINEKMFLTIIEQLIDRISEAWTIIIIFSSSYLLASSTPLVSPSLGDFLPFSCKSEVHPSPTKHDSNPLFAGWTYNSYPYIMSIIYHTFAKLNSFGKSLWICSHTDLTRQPFLSFVSTIGSLKSGPWFGFFVYTLTKSNMSHIFSSKPSKFNFKLQLITMLFGLSASIFTSSNDIVSILL